MKNESLMLTIAILFIAMSSEAQVTDKDRNTYKTVKIGTQVWMGEHLTVAHFRNGDSIPEARTQEDWTQAGDEGNPAWCHYENNPANGEKYGKLYNAISTIGAQPRAGFARFDFGWRAFRLVG